MKKLNFKWLWKTDSHEKQKPQRFGRYAAMLIMLLTLGVGQMWADWYVQGSGTGLGGWGNGAKMTQNPASTSIYYRRVSGTCEFKVTSQEDGYTGEKGSGAINNSHAGANVTLSNSNGNIKSTQSGTWYICYDSSTEKVYAQTSLPAPAPTAVVSGSSFMFYIKSYDNWKHAVTPNSTSTYINGSFAGGDATSWVTLTSSQKSTYTYITNNRGGWGGKQNSNISSTKGGELYQANDNVTTTARKTASTTASVSGDVLSISTTTDATSGVYGSLSLYIQYYIDGTFAGVTYSSSTASYGSITAGGATARTSTYDVSGLTNGTHKLKTVLTDGNIFWVPDSDNFTVAHVYSITYKDEGNEDYSGSNLASLPSSYTYGIGIATLTDGVRAGYDFDGWFDTKECDGSVITSISSSATGAKTLYAKWTLSATNSLVTAAGTGISSTSGDTDPVTLGSKYSISATVATGYTFSTWTADPAANGTFDNASLASTKVTVKNGSVTVTASATENMSSLTTSCHYDAGNPGYSNPTVSNSATNVGYVTTRSITAPAAGTGYTFVGWTLTNCTRTDGGGATANPITIRSNGDGASATVVANYEEVLTTSYVLKGGSAFGGTAWESEYALTKKSGHADDDIAYYTATMSSTNTSSDANFKFKIVLKGASDTWYGIGNTDPYAINRNTGEQTMSSSGNNMELRADVAGDYEIKVDYSTPASPKITVTFPPTLTWTSTSVYSGNASALTASVSNIESGKSLKYEVFAGATATGVAVATYNTTTSATTDSHEFSITPSFGANDISKQYTVKITYNGSQVSTCTGYIYRKWDIKVNNNCHWVNGVYYYAFNNGTNDDWPGVECEAFCGSWYTVTLDGRYPNFILGNGNVSCAKEQTGDLTTSISTYAAGSTWQFTFSSEEDDGCSGKNKYYTLASASLSAPTVTLTTYDVISTTQIYVEGTITGYGNAGSQASDMCEVGFKIGETKYTTTCTDGSVFKRYITGLTANTSYSVKAYVTSPHSTVESSATAHTTRATGSYTIKVRSGVSDPVPYIRAFVWSDEGCGGTGIIENASGNGEAMTLYKTGTVYKWYTYSLSNVYQKFYINENASSTETWDHEAPLAETCYWYKHGAVKNERFGTLPCPSFATQLMIEDEPDGEFQYNDMKGSGPYTYEVSLAAKSTYKFKPIHNGEWLGKASVELTRASNSATGLSAAVEDNLEITTDAAGDYTFTFTAPGTIAVTYQDAYVVNFGAGDGGTASASATSAGGTLTTGDYVADGDDVSFSYDEDDGYTFTGWFTSADGSTTASEVVSNTITDISDDADVYAQFSENMTTVALEHNAHGHVENGSGATITSIDAGVDTHPEITAVADDGYYFAGWEPKEGESDEYTIPGAHGESNTTIAVTGKGNIVASGQTLIAKFVELEKIYFRNENETTGGKLWDVNKMYVYFNVDWGISGASENGVTTSSGKFAEMNPVSSGSKIFWAYIPRAITTANYTKIAFSDVWMGSSAYPGGLYGEFWKNKGVYRTDYIKYLNMYVPASKSNRTSNSTVYYDDGYWMKYDTQAAQGASYYLKESTGAGELSEFKISAANGTSIVTTYRFENTTAKRFYIANAKGTFYKANSDITSVACADVEMGTGNGGFLVTPTSEGTYTFTIDQSGDTMKISVNYPVSTGDYRLLYTYDTDKTRESDVIKFESTVQTNRKSMYIDPTGGVSLKLQKCTGINALTKQPTWTTGVSVGTLSSVFTSGKGVYVFDITINNTGKAANADPAISLSNKALYDGPYYLKTDYAPGGWVNYEQNVMDQNTINFSKEKSETFDYYRCAWVGDGDKNVKCIVANDYNQQITDTLIGDDVLGKMPDGTTDRQYLATEANVRFSYNSNTNELKRAYINGSSGWEASFLMLYGEENKVRKSSSDATRNLTFHDDNNWIYDLDLEAKPNARYRLAANYKFNSTNHYQNFKGDVSVDWSTASTEQLIGECADAWQKLHIIYDFKTNNLIIAWLPSGSEISTTINLYTDVLLIHNRKKVADPGDVVTMVNLTGSAELTDINRVYSAFRFQKTADATYVGMTGSPANSAESYYRYNYWISFPYDVKMTDIFGFDGYGSKWRIQRYAGDKRATNGWYKGDGVSSFWETMPMSDDAKLNKGEGYVLQLSPSAFQKTTTGGFWDNSVTEVYLYFPSKAGFGDIERKTSSVSLSSLPCTKGLFSDGSGKSHNITDSHWHVFGIPTFDDATGTTGSGTYYDGDDAEDANLIEDDDFYFYVYENTADASTYNVYTATSSDGFTFQPMHAYMIQMTGTLSFATNSVPASVAARQRKETKNYDLRVELKNNDVECDHTFVKLRDSAVSDFALNEDLTKIHNSGKSNIYSYAGAYDVAANILPIESHTIALGVEAAANGYYTFTMPSNFDGEVTLVDRVAETRTNLAMSDYEVYLEKGEINDRFDLEINIKKVATAIDGGGSFKDGKAHKFIENGVLYILRDGKVYDATGNLVK